MFFQTPKVDGSSAWHSLASARFHYSIHYVCVSLNSGLQAGIWFGCVDPSPIINLSPTPLYFSHFFQNVVFSEHVCMLNTNTYISFITLNSISGLDR